MTHLGVGNATLARRLPAEEGLTLVGEVFPVVPRVEKTREMSASSSGRVTSIQLPKDGGLLPRDRCRVMGLNQNFSSRAGTAYHIQIEDRGPVFDDATEEWVRRVNTVVYANYGEPTARIVYGRDRDYPDFRTLERNRFIETQIREAAAEVKVRLEEREKRQCARIRALLHRYHLSRDEAVRAEFDEANRLYPFVFARAWQELKAERVQAEAVAPTEPLPPRIEETIYPLESAQRELVLEIERVREGLEHDLEELKAAGAADDVLLAICAKMLNQPHGSLARQAETGSDFAQRRLEMTKNTLVAIYRQVRARLSRSESGRAEGQPVAAAVTE
jgi:hypothetical protein